MSLHPEFAPIAILSALSLILPLPWHWRARNVATVSLIGWLFICNMIYGIDALVWGHELRIVVPVWCDITTKLIIGTSFALPAACLCISIHLEQVASIRVARSSASDKRRRQLFEAGMCVGLPVLFMALHYIVQGHRFDIIEGYGCRPTTYFSIVALFIVWIPPIVISCIAFIFSALALRHFVIRRLAFAAHLKSGNSALTTSRYLRLMTMAALQMVCSLSFTAYSLWFTAKSVPIRPWTTWSDVHSDFLRVDRFPDAFTPDFIKKTYYILWWLIPISTFLFVAFFSFGKDAMDEYRKCFVWFRAKVLRIKPDNGSKSGFSGIPLSHSKFLRGMPISNPLPDKSPLKSQAPGLHTPPYSLSNKTAQPSLTDFHSDTHSEVTRYEEASYDKTKAIDAYTDISLHTPTTAGSFASEVAFRYPAIVPDLPSPPCPLPPPPSNPRLRDLILLPSSSPPTRPLTYPSFDAISRSIKPPQPQPHSN